MLQVPYAGMPFEVVALNKLHHPSPTLPATHEGRTFSAVCLLPPLPRSPEEHRPPQ